MKFSVSMKQQSAVYIDSASVIDALGGSHAVADALNESLATVSNWRTRGFPPRVQKAMAALCRRKRVKAAPELFWVLA